MYALPADKANHVIAGALAALAAVALSNLLRVPYWPPIIALVAGVAAGAGKELYDYLDNRASVARGDAPAHGVELLDAVATAAGGLVVGLGILASSGA